MVVAKIFAANARIFLYPLICDTVEILFFDAAIFCGIIF
jgi:hypothetical protein